MVWYLHNFFHQYSVFPASLEIHAWRAMIIVPWFIIVWWEVDDLVSELGAPWVYFHLFAFNLLLSLLVMQLRLIVLGNLGLYTWEIMAKRDREWYRERWWCPWMFLYCHCLTLVLGIIGDGEVVLVTILRPIFFTLHERILSLQGDCNVDRIWCPSGWHEDACWIQEHLFSLRKKRSLAQSPTT